VSDVARPASITSSPSSPSIKPTVDTPSATASSPSLRLTPVPNCDTVNTFFFPVAAYTTSCEPDTETPLAARAAPPDTSPSAASASA
jgi:hypothetical protein